MLYSNWERVLLAVQCVDCQITRISARRLSWKPWYNRDTAVLEGFLPCWCWKDENLLGQYSCLKMLPLSDCFWQLPHNEISISSRHLEQAGEWVFQEAVGGLTDWLSSKNLPLCEIIFLAKFPDIKKRNKSSSVEMGTVLLYFFPRWTKFPTWPPGGGIAKILINWHQHILCQSFAYENNPLCVLLCIFICFAYAMTANVWISTDLV